MEDWIGNIPAINFITQLMIRIGILYISQRTEFSSSFRSWRLNFENLGKCNAMLAMTVNYIIFLPWVVAITNGYGCFSIHHIYQINKNEKKNIRYYVNKKYLFPFIASNNKISLIHFFYWHLVRARIHSIRKNIGVNIKSSIVLSCINSYDHAPNRMIP